MNTTHFSLPAWMLGVSLTLLATAAQAQPASGHRFLANEGRTLFIFAASGEPEWEMELAGAPHDMHWLANGHILTHQNTDIIEIDPATRKIVWSWDAAKLATAERIEVHSMAPLPNDRIMVAVSGEGRIFEIDRDGKIQHSVKLKVDHPNPHRDTRLVRPLDDGQYLVAREGDGVVRQYDREGNVVWEFAVPMFGQTARDGHGPESFGNSVFSAIRLDNGNTLIGTGNGHRVLEVSPDKKIVWQLKQNDLPGITLAWVTTLEAHADGSIVVGNCHAGPENPQLIQINRDKQVLWTFRDFKKLGNSVSNSQILDATGKVIR